MMRTMVAVAAGLIAAAAVAEEAKPTTSPFRDGETVVFWGDSITQQAKWIRFLTDFYHTRYPDRKITYRNAGIAGNSFGGGIKEIDRDVAPWKPTTVFTMFGMNDSAAAGPYHPGWPSTDEEKAKLRQRVDRGYQVDADRALKDLKAKCGADLRIVMMTPSIYDSTARTPKEKPVNDGWNTTLGESGKKLIAGYEAGKWELVDLWNPMTKFNAWAQAMNPNFSIVSAQERVHPDDNGGWFMAQQILKAQGVDRTVSEIRFDAAKAGEYVITVKAYNITTPMSTSLTGGKSNATRYSLAVLGAQIVGDIILRNVNEDEERLLQEGEMPAEVLPIFTFAIGCAWDREAKMPSYKLMDYATLCDQRKFAPVYALGAELYHYTFGVLKKREREDRAKAGAAKYKWDAQTLQHGREEFKAFCERARRVHAAWQINRRRFDCPNLRNGFCSPSNPGCPCYRCGRCEEVKA